MTTVPKRCLTNRQLGVEEVIYSLYEFDKALFEGAATFPSRAKLNPVEHRDEMPLDNAIMDFSSE